ncbi:hypothetical protein ABZY57_30835 [Streptomyces sp. NPDC006450]|uniref:hypothetical protein n=1 Tax=Streptomyces sp. NPDC006450 TaxID=3155458 RepID=UPI0033B3338E
MPPKPPGRRPGKRIPPFADELVRLLHAAWLRTVLISGSPHGIVRRAAAELAIAFEPDPVLRGWTTDRDWITADRRNVLAACQDLIATHPVPDAARETTRGTARGPGLGIAGPR